MGADFINLTEFNKAIEKYASKLLPEEFNRWFRKIAFDALAGIIKMTPVGNKENWKDPKKAPPGYVGGRARGNWLVSINSFSDAPTNDIDDSGGATRTKGLMNMTGARIGDIIYITNNVPYIKRLEEGWSREQAPNGMVALTFGRLAIKYGG